MESLWEWVWEMQGELTVADAASSRYRGRISTEITGVVQEGYFIDL